MKIVYTCVLLVSLSVMAEPLTIIYDSGDTLPIDEYQTAIQDERDSQKPVFMAGDNSFLPRFPLTTPSMTPGIIDSRSISLPYLQVPLFIIGNDAFSLQWLTQRRAELVRLKAVGMLMEVSSLGELKSIRQLASGLSLYPASGSDIAAQLKLKHYPVLISSQGVEQ